MTIDLKPMITVNYKDSPSKRGLQLMKFSAPFWLLWAPAAIVWLGQALIVGGFFADLVLLTLWSFFVWFTAICAFTVFVCIQNKFQITSKGIQFPLRCLLQVGHSLYRPWTKLLAITFVNTERTDKLAPSRNPNSMMLHFADSNLPLELAAFSKQDLQSFLLALQSYVPELLIQPPLSEVELAIDKNAKTRQDASFTQIWENDMASRFGSTVFVPLEPGNKLQNGRLEVVGQIAFGGLSAIYLAKDKDSQLCVIKEAIVPANSDHESAAKALEMFQRESQLLMTLSNPRIARVFDHFIENGRHYMVLEYIDGKDLRRYVKERGAQNEALVLRWAIDVAQILDYLHKLSPPIIHRDLTPDNLVLERNGGIVLIDFGAANQFLGAATGTLVGKQSYISPEQFRGYAEPASDLYALGATMSYLLTGEDPEPLSASHPRSTNPELSESLDAFIAKLTDLEVAERFDCAESVVLELKKLLNDRKSLTINDA